MIISLIYNQNAYTDAISDIAGEKVQVCLTKEEALKYLPETEIIVTIGGGNFSVPLDEEMLQAAPSLKWVFSVSAGVEKLPLKELKERGILATNTSGVHAVTIAEYVMGGLLVMSHHYDRYLPLMKEKKWGELISGEDMEGKTILIIGAGHIGSEIGRKAGAFDMQVFGLKRTPCEIDGFDGVYSMDKLKEMLPKADYVVMAAPLTQETYHLIGEEEFALMKKEAVFVNIARGDTVEEEALIAALREGRIQGAVLDVFHEEPLPEASPLWELDNVLITPHSSAISKNVIKKIIRMFKESYEKYKKGETLINEL
ncbi:D-2-hydroxyacid dehydrogenase [Anaerocolumna jejuensis]|uniref:D-2-hydroxyacid dehydrogenase n=1 Tax=Anaerocolumna jejuensis TaxID=259063 RepID=UPI003F7BCA67